eukprot:156687-Hanusia_phi.AAC.2
MTYYFISSCCLTDFDDWALNLRVCVQSQNENARLQKEVNFSRYEEHDETCSSGCRPAEGEGREFDAESSTCAAQ